MNILTDTNSTYETCDGDKVLLVRRAVTAGIRLPTDEGGGKLIPGLVDCRADPQAESDLRLVFYNDKGVAHHHDGDYWASRGCDLVDEESAERARLRDLIRQALQVCGRLDTNEQGHPWSHISVVSRFVAAAPPHLRILYKDAHGNAVADNVMSMLLRNVFGARGEVVKYDHIIDL